MIVDHYWPGPPIRLRMLQDNDEVAYKLGQKVRVEFGNPELVKITNIYLSENDFRALSVIPAAIVAKSRWTVESGGVTYSVDEFKGRHAGLVLAEIELREDEPRLSGPEFALSEVTSDDQYCGGWLASASAADLLRIIQRGTDSEGDSGSR